MTPRGGPVNGSTSGTRPARSAELVGMFALAVLLRVSIVLAVALTQHATLNDIARLRDGVSYLTVARALGGDPSGLNIWTARVFPGLPALMFGLRLAGLPLPLAGLVLSWGAAGVTSVLTAVVFRSARLGWAVAVFTPTYVMCSSVIMTEAPLLALSLAGAWLAGRRHDAASGLVFGLAGLVRPVAGFVVLGVMADAAARGHWKRALRIGVLALAVLTVGYVVVSRAAGTLGQTLSSYQIFASGPLFTWPFDRLITSSLRGPLWKTVYVWLNVALVLAGLVGAVRERLRRTGGRSEDAGRWALPWLAGNSLLIFTAAPEWAFSEFHRYLVAALPANLYFLRGAIPGGRIGRFVVLACAILVLAGGAWRLSAEMPG